MASFDATITVDPNDATVNGQDAGPAAVITGDVPPTSKTNWWPWIIGAALLGAVWWYIEQDDDAEEGAEERPPFDG